MKIFRALSVGVGYAARGAAALGRGTIALIGICGVVAALANYTMTQGSGTTFGSIVVSTVHYAQMLICDPTTPSQCGSVDVNGQQKIDVNTTNNNLYTAITAAVPYLPATTPTTNTYTTNVNSPANGDLHGALYVDLTSLVGTQLGAPSNFGTTPGAVEVLPVNASLFQGTTAVVAEPCQTNAKTRTTINFTASGLQTTPVVAGVSAKKTYICQILVNNAVADTIAIFGATTGTSCGTGAYGLYGGTTAATGMQLAANSGFSDGDSGYATNFTTNNNDDICFNHSASGQVSGKIVTVQQ